MKLGLEDVIRSHIITAMTNVYTSIPARVTKVGVVGKGVVVDAQPMINRTEVDGSVFETPIIPEVPVIFPAGGGALISLPMVIGDTVMLMFSMRSTEEFLAGDATIPQTPFDKRSHSLSDAIAIPGLFTSITSPEISTTDVQIRNGIGGDTESTIDVKPDGNITINAENVIVNAATKIELGEGATEAVIKGDVFKAYSDGHVHPTGVGPSGPPTVPLPASALSTLVKTV